MYFSPPSFSEVPAVRIFRHFLRACLSLRFSLTQLSHTVRTGPVSVCCPYGTNALIESVIVLSVELVMSFGIIMLTHNDLVVLSTLNAPCVGEQFPPSVRS